jgi:hypothetical protein
MVQRRLCPFRGLIKWHAVDMVVQRVLDVHEVEEKAAAYACSQRPTCTRDQQQRFQMYRYAQ